VRSVQPAPGESGAMGADAESPLCALPLRRLSVVAPPPDPDVYNGASRFPTHRSLTVGRMREAINRPGADTRTVLIVSE
jgi:hypothetical protein